MSGKEIQNVTIKSVEIMDNALLTYMQRSMTPEQRDGRSTAMTPVQDYIQLVRKKFITPFFNDTADEVYFAELKFAAVNKDGALAKAANGALTFAPDKEEARYRVVKKMKDENLYPLSLPSSLLPAPADLDSYEREVLVPLIFSEPGKAEKPVK